MSSNVDDFADEEEAGNESGFHGLAGEFAGIDTAGGDFRFRVAFRIRGNERPVVQLLFERSERRIGVVGQRMEFKPTLGKTVGKKLLEEFASGGEIAMRRGAEVGGRIELRCKIEMNGAAFFPVGGDLEDRRTAQAAMREKHFFAKGIVGGGGDDFRRDASKFGIAARIGPVESKRNKSGTRGDDLVAKLASEVVAEGSSAHFGDRETAGGDNESGSAEFRGIRAQNEFGGALHFGDAGVEKNLNVGGAAFGFEKIGDVRGGMVAEELAERFFVIKDAMFLDEGEKIVGSETGEGGFCEMRIGGEEIFGSGVNVGEVAAASAGDEDFFADAIGVFEQRDTAAAFACLEGAEETSGTSAED